MITTELAAWIAEQAERPGFLEFMQLITEQRQDAERSALTPGDTEWHKGGASALRIVEALPNQILRLSRPKADKH